jgi:hypothetical protein
VQLFSRNDFKRIVNRYDGDKYTKTMDCWQQLLVLLYAQVKELKSLRDIETSLRTHADKWMHIGLESVARSTLADANSDRPHQIFGELFYAFLEKCQKIAPKHGFKVDMPVFTLDSTTISLCLSSFPWAKYRKRKGALKLHMLLDHDGCLPSFVSMSDGKCHDVRFAKEKDFGLPALPPDSILTIDRGYLDYNWLYSLHEKGTTFIIRSKANMKYDIAGQHKKPNKSRGIMSDSVIELSNFYQSESYPDQLRLIRFYDKDENKELEFVTNNFTLAASTIASLYKGRWEIETFFKWIKQHLRIKTFLGTSENAVMIQVWVAMILYILLSFIKFQTKYAYSKLELLRIIRELLWESKSILEILRVNAGELIKNIKMPVQLAFY